MYEATIPGTETAAQALKPQEKGNLVDNCHTTISPTPPVTVSSLKLGLK
jgi:hypothetical protein